MSESKAPVSRKRVLLALNLSSFSWSVGLGAAVPVIPLLSRQLAKSITLAGLVVAEGGMGRLVVSYISGPMMDKFGRRKVAIIGVTIRMIFSFMEGIAARQTYYHLLAYRFMSGVGTAIWGVGQATIAADISTSRDRGAITGGRMALSQLGHVLGPFLGAWAWGVTRNIMVPFFINGFSKMICLLLFLFVMGETKELSASSQKAPAQRGGRQQQEGDAGRNEVAQKGIKAALLTSGLPFILYGLFADALFREGINNLILPIYVKDVLQRSQAELGAIISAIALGGVIVALPAGRIIDRFGIKAAIVPGALLLLGGLLILGQNITNGVPLPLSVGLGMGLGLVTVGIQALAIDISPLGARGGFFGKTQAAAHFATFTGPLAIGQFTESFGYSSVFLLVASLFALMLPMSLLLIRGGSSRKADALDTERSSTT